MASWTQWTGTWDPEATTPYIDWFDTLLPDTFGPADARSDLSQVTLPLYVPAEAGGEMARLWLPEETINPGFDPAAPLVPDLAGLANPPPAGSVITGIVDTGISLFDHRLRDASGNTRIRASWMQGAKASSATRNLPFGGGLFQAEIGALIGASRNVQDNFDMASGLQDYLRFSGNRELGLRAAHGAHVADLAAGLPTGSADGGPVIAIDLPNRSVVGLDGAFLDLFVHYGICWITAVSDALWRQGGYAPVDGVSGYPIVINFSFGKQAGARDQSALFLETVAKLNAERAVPDAEGRIWSKIHIVLPAGNDNLARVHAVQETDVAPEPIRMIVAPEDQSSNFVDIWSDPIAGQFAGGPVPLAISVAAPGGALQGPGAGQSGKFADLGAAARIYCAVVQSPESYRIRYLVAIGPTDPPAEPTHMAPSGPWHIALAWTGTAHRVTLDIQTDQSPRIYGTTGRRAYFDVPDYQRFDSMGSPLDSYSYTPRYYVYRDAKPELTDLGQVVRRRGTLNAFAPVEGGVVVAGYRQSDGRPSDYSATGDTRERPTLSYPNDAAPSIVGMLASGSQDGAVVGLRGTSFASAQTTRDAAELLQTAGPGHGVDLAVLLTDLPDERLDYYGATAPLKAGASYRPARDPGRPTWRDR